MGGTLLTQLVGQLLHRRTSTFTGPACCACIYVADELHEPLLNTLKRTDAQLTAQTRDNYAEGAGDLPQTSSGLLKGGLTAFLVAAGTSCCTR